MKKLILIISFLFSYIYSFAQPEIRRSSAVNTPVDPNLFTINSFRIPIFNDTLSALAVTSLDSAGKLIFTRDVMAVWVRRHSPKRWDRLVSGTAGDFIQNQFASAQTPANYWISGNARIDGYQQFGTAGRIQNDGGTISITNTNPIITGADLRVKRLLFYNDAVPTVHSTPQIYTANTSGLDIEANFMRFRTPSWSTYTEIFFSLGNQRPFIIGGETEGSYIGDEILTLYNQGDDGIPGNAVRSQLGFSGVISDSARKTIAKIGSEMTNFTAAAFAADLVFYTSVVTVGNGVPQEQFRIRSDGDAIWDKYPSTRNDGVLLKVFGTDANGRMLLGTVSAGGVTSIPPNIGSGHRIFSPQIPGFKTLFGSYGFDMDSTTNANAITFKIDSTRWATQNDISIFLDGTDTVSLSNRLNFKQDTTYRINDSTIGYTIGGRVHSFEIKGGVSGGGGGASGITSINTLTDAVQTFSFDETGLTPGVLSASGVHTFNHPLASAAGVTNGGITKAEYDIFNAKQPAGNYITGLIDDVFASGPGIVSATIQPNVISDGKIRQSTGLSVIGRSANTTGNVADITAALDFEVLRRSGGSIGFGQINLSSPNAVTGVLPLANITVPTLQQVFNTQVGGAVLTKKDTILNSGYKLFFVGTNGWLGNESEYAHDFFDLQAPVTVGLLDTAKLRSGSSSSFGGNPAAALYVDRVLRHPSVTTVVDQSTRYGLSVDFTNEMADSARINTLAGDLVSAIIGRMEWQKLSGYTGRTVIEQPSYTPLWAVPAVIGIHYFHGGTTSTNNIYAKGWYSAITGESLIGNSGLYYDTVENYVNILASGASSTPAAILHNYMFFGDVNLTGGGIKDLYGVYIEASTAKNYFAGSLQIGTNGGTTYQETPATSNLVEFNSTTKGFRMMRMTGAQQNAITSPATGLMIYNTDSLAHTFYNGTVWRKFSAGGTGSADVIVPVGTNYKIGIANTLNIKGLLAGYGITLDSATANSVRITTDTATLATYIRSTMPVGLPISLLLNATATNSINHANFGQSWAWTPTSASTVGLTLSRTGTLGTVLQAGKSVFTDTVRLAALPTGLPTDSLLTTFNGVTRRILPSVLDQTWQQTLSISGGSFLTQTNNISFTGGFDFSLTTESNSGALYLGGGSIARLASIGTTGYVELESHTSTAVKNNRLILSDSIKIMPWLGVLNVDSLRSWSTITDTLYKKPMTWDTRSGRWEYLTYWPLSSSGGGSGITNLNGLTGGTQLFAVGTTGTDFAVVSSGTTHSFNLPTASATNRGALSTTDWSTFNNKVGSLTVIGSTPNANGATITSGVLNLQPADGSFGGVLTTTTQTLGAGDKTLSGFSTINGFKTNATATSSNFNIMSNGGTTATLTQLIFAGSSTVEMRAYARGSGTLSVAAGRSAAHWVFGDQSLTEAGSSIHPLFAGYVFKQQTFTDGAGATTNLANVYIEAPPTGITPTDKSVSLWSLGDIRIGKFGSARGRLLLEGPTSGTVILTVADIAGSWTFTLPTAYPAVNGYVLTGNTNGTSQWVAPTPVTDLSYTASPTNGIVVSSTGTDATIPLVTTTNAGLMSSSMFDSLSKSSFINIVAGPSGFYQIGRQRNDTVMDLKALRFTVNGGSSIVPTVTDTTAYFNIIAASGFVTATNGLTASTSTNVVLGGTLTQVTTIDAGSAYYLAVTASGANSNLLITNSSTGRAITATSISGTTIHGTATTGKAAQFVVNPSSTNTVVTIMDVQRLTSGTGAAGIGGSIDFWTQTSTTGRLSNQLISNWSTATDATRTSQFIISGVLSSTTVNLLTIDGIGTYTFAGTSSQPGEIRFYEDTDFGSNYTAFKVGAAQSSNLTYTWPSAYPTASTWVLTSSTSGALAWADVFSISKPRIGGGTTSATPTPDWDTQDDYILTALSSNATFGAPTGTPVQAQEIIVRITCDGTNRTLAFNAIYRGSTDIPLPTQILANTTMYMKFKYNTTVSRVDMIALTSGFN